MKTDEIVTPSIASLRAIPVVLRALAYRNPDPRCCYPFELSPLGYCWGYAIDVDAGRERTEEACEACDCWNPEGDSQCKSSE